MSTDLRERKKDATRRALAERALALTVERGFHGFTISELVADVGVSRRTFSNYFDNKADCVAAVAEGWLDDVLDSIHSAPRGTSLVEVLRAGLATVARQGDQRWGTLQAVVDDVPELAGRVALGDELVVDRVSDEVADWCGLEANDIRVRLVARFAVTAGREVLSRWAASGAARTTDSLATLLESAFSILDVTGLEQ